MKEAVTGSLQRPEHPGSGRRQARVLPKGRQAGLEAREVIEELLGDNPRRRDLLIEYLHRIQDRTARSRQICWRHWPRRCGFPMRRSMKSPLSTPIST
jgi:hypothetical protein